MSTECIRSNKLQIMINTRIPGNEKIKYEPFMTLPNDKSDNKYVYVNPFIPFEKEKIYSVTASNKIATDDDTKKKEEALMPHSNRTNPDIYRQFFEKKKFRQLIKRNFKKPEKILKAEIEKGEEEEDTEEYEKNKEIQWEEEIAKLEKKKKDDYNVKNYKDIITGLTDKIERFGNPGPDPDNWNTTKESILANEKQKLERDKVKAAEEKLKNPRDPSLIKKYDEADKQLNEQRNTIETDKTALEAELNTQIAMQEAQRMAVLNVDNQIKDLKYKIEGQEDVNKQIIKHNIRLTLDILFAKDNLFYIKRQPYTIYDYEWLNEHTDHGFKLIKEATILTDYVDYTAIGKTGKKKNLYEEYIRYLNTFWEKYEYRRKTYPLFEDIGEFFLAKNVKKKIYDNDDLKRARETDRKKTDYFKRQKRLREGQIIDVKNNRNKNRKYGEKTIPVSSTPKENDGRIIKNSATDSEPVYTNIEGEEEDENELDKFAEEEQAKKTTIPKPQAVVGGQSGGEDDEDVKTKMEKLYGKGDCIYIVEINLDIVPGKKIDDRFKGRLSCSSKKEKINDAFNDLMGNPRFKRSPLEIKEIRQYSEKDRIMTKGGGYTRKRKRRGKTLKKRHRNKTKTRIRRKKTMKKLKKKN